MTITEKVSYLKGLAEGLEHDPSVKEVKLLNAIIDEHITNVKSAKKFSQVMVKNANFDGFLPKLGVAEIEKAFSVGVREKKEVK